MKGKEIVKDTLEGKNTSHRTAQQLWLLPWADIHYHEELAKISADFPSDIAGCGARLEIPPVTKGQPHEAGIYIDEWGCEFRNITRGIIGEVKVPLVKEDDWSDADKVHFPEELLTFDVDEVNENIRKNFPDTFLHAGSVPRPFEQLQFIRGTAEFYMDLMDPPEKMLEFMEKMEDYYCRLLTKWAQTDVDCLMIMDDWGSQKSLLISDSKWDEFFAPMYRKFIDIAHKYGKKCFMHSDGYTLSIIPKLIDMGLDAINTQIFCIGVEKLRQFKGKITFWGEIDRQILLPYGSKEEIRAAVKSVYDNLYDNGYCIAQCEFGIGANPENVYEVFRTWNELTAR